MTTPDRPDLDALARLVAGWRTSFPFDAINGDLACHRAGDHLYERVDDIDDAWPQVATMLNALPALIAYARRVEGERDEARMLSANNGWGDRAREHAAELDGLIKERDALRAELTAERDAHHATCDALARERAEVERLRERLEVQHMAEANRIAGAGGCCGGCDAAWLTADVDRLEQELVEAQSRESTAQEIHNESAAQWHAEVAQAERERAETVAMYAASQAECERLRGLVEEACSMFYGAAGCIDPRDEAAASACHEAGHRVEAIRKEAAGE